MKIALCSVVSDEFVAGFICMYRSLVRHNPAWSFPFFVFSHPENCPLSEEGRALIATHCEQAIFVEVDNKDYEGIHHYAENVIGTPPRLRAAFYILEAFRLPGFDLVIALDSDLLVLGSLEELFYETSRFSAVRARDGKTGEALRFVNTGVMVIGKTYLYPEIIRDFTTALKTRPLLPGSGKADQAILNIFFQNRTINYLPAIFNFTKRSLLSLLGPEAACDRSRILEFLAARDIRVLHFVGEKPWDTKVRKFETDYQAIEDLWFEAFYETATVASARWLDRRRRAHELDLRHRLLEAAHLLAAPAGLDPVDFEKKIEVQIRKGLEDPRGEVLV